MFSSLRHFLFIMDLLVDPPQKVQVFRYFQWNFNPDIYESVVPRFQIFLALSRIIMDLMADPLKVPFKFKESVVAGEFASLFNPDINESVVPRFQIFLALSRNFKDLMADHFKSTIFLRYSQ